MKKIIEYKGYKCSWDYDKWDGIYYGQIEEIKDSVSCHSGINNPDKTIKEAVDDYIETLNEINKMKKGEAFRSKRFTRVGAMSILRTGCFTRPFRCGLPGIRRMRGIRKQTSCTKRP